MLINKNNLKYFMAMSYLVAQLINAEPLMQEINPSRVTEQESIKEPSLHLLPNVIPTPLPPMPTFQEHSKTTETFFLKDIVLEGATALSKSTLIAPFKDKIKTQVSLQDVLTMAEMVTIVYRQHGYILANTIVPPQTVEDGLVKFQIFEGTVDTVSIEGLNGSVSLRMVERYAKQIQKEPLLKASTLERYALLINRIPGITAKMILGPSTTTVGAAHLTILITEHQPINASLQFDNYVSKKYGPEQLTGNIYYNASNVGSKISLNAKKSTTQNRLNLYSINYEQLLGNDGLKFSIHSQRIKTKPKLKNAVLLNLNGISKILSFEFSYPFILSRRQSLFFDTQFDIESAKSDGHPASQFHDELRSIRLGVQYETVDRFKGSNYIQLKYSKGLKTLGATKTLRSADPNVGYSRPGGRSDYQKINFNAQRLQFLPHHFSALLSIHGQYSFHELLSSEECGFGGRHFGRGYDVSRLTGEHGLMGQVELRYDLNSHHTYVNKCQLYANYDTGIIWNKRGQKIIINGIPKRRASAASASIGIRTVLYKYLSTSFEIAKPFTLPEIDNTKRPRLFFSLIWSY